MNSRFDKGKTQTKEWQQRLPYDKMKVCELKVKQRQKPKKER
jgi:hypothetical protein